MSVVSKMVLLEALPHEVQNPIPKIPILWCDSISVVAMNTSPILHIKTKHIELDCDFIHEKVL